MLIPRIQSARICSGVFFIKVSWQGKSVGPQNPGRTDSVTRGRELTGARGKKQARRAATGIGTKTTANAGGSHGTTGWPDAVVPTAATRGEG